MQERKCFDISEIANMDQTLISFEFLGSRTYQSTSSWTVQVKTAQSGQDKQQATLQIVLHADGEPRCKPLLIFYKKGDKKGYPFYKSLRAKYKLYNKQVVVAFNDKAYANTDTMLEQLWSQYAHSLAYLFRRQELNHKPQMLTFDVFKGQLNNKVLAKFKQMNCTCSFIPSRTTGFIQVCDVAINKPLKDQISELAEIHYDNHKDQWIKNKYTVSNRRVMLVSQVAQAWDDLHKYNSESIRQAFRDVGLSLPTDGSQDDKIKIKDLPSIEVGNSQDRALKKGAEQPSDEGEVMMSNRTLQEVED